MWAVGAGAHNAFERLFYEAVITKKLRLLDGLTRIPLVDLPPESHARIVELGCVVQTAPDTEAVITPRPPVATTNKLRRNNLDPAIDKAINQAGNMELADVYLKLKTLAIDEEKPFTGVLEGDALCYTNDDNITDKLTKNALGKRLKIRRLLPLAAFSGG